MPGKVKVKILGGKNLPVMDRSNGTTDAYVQVKLGNITHQTDVCWKTLNPQWNSEWFRFEMDDLELQDEPLQIRLMDHDTYSANDSIGKVYIDLNPLLTNPSKTKEPSGRSMSGWIPVYDTMHGIRGEVNLLVKVELFADLNKFRQSSCGVKFFFSPNIPEGHQAIQIHGFVEELVVNDDPEYQWIDKIRTPKASNEARQTLFTKLSGVVHRKVGLKALELGGNAVIGYRQCFDLEGESGIVVRGIGTAATLAKCYESQLSPLPDKDGSPKHFGTTGGIGCVELHEESSSGIITKSLLLPDPIPEEHTTTSTTLLIKSHHHHLPPHFSEYNSSNSVRKGEGERIMGSDGTSTLNSTTGTHKNSTTTTSHNTTTTNTTTTAPKIISPMKIMGTNSGGIGIYGRRSSESDLSTPPKGILNSSIQAMLAAGGKNSNYGNGRRAQGNSDHFDMLEYPFITISDLPAKFIQRIGGSVSARSVKLLERISNLEEPVSRDSWWTEIRMEIRSHARSICCNVILGYEEHTTICDDVCILSATGTAAVVNSSVLGNGSEDSSKFNLSLIEQKGEKEKIGVTRNESMPPNSGVGRTLSFSGPREKSEGSSANFNSANNELLDQPFTTCSIAHVPYNESGIPFSVKMARCGICKRGRVPDIILSTINLPSGMPIAGKSCLIQAQIFRPKMYSKGESSAREVSDHIPFLEYELHRTLINKLKVKGMNAVFCLSIQICLGENLIMAIATGTALCLLALPLPDMPEITAGNLGPGDEKLLKFQKSVQDAYDRNREFYRVAHLDALLQSNGGSHGSEDESEEESPLINLGTGNKGTYVLEVDDSEDIEIISELIEPSAPIGFDMSNLDSVIGLQDFIIHKQQMFVYIWRHRISSPSQSQLSSLFDRILRSISFTHRSMSPCIVNKIRFRLELPEVDEMQICVTGTALGLKKKVKISSQESPAVHTPAGNKGGENSSGSVLEGTKIPITVSCPSSPSPPLTGVGGDSAVPTMLHGDSGEIGRGRTVSPMLRPLLTPSLFPFCSIPSLSPYNKNTPIKMRPMIEITTLSHIPGQKIEKYLGNLNFFFIRETTNIREMGGSTGFVHSFVMEAMAILRGHVSALGGNALVSYFMTELSLLYNPHKNQGQCLISVGGDAVLSAPLEDLK